MTATAANVVTITRAELLAHLDTLATASHVAPCLTWRDAGWTSDDPDEQRLAAHLCGRCPALAPCLEYGDANPCQFGVYGGQIDSQRHAPARRGDLVTTRTNPSTTTRKRD